MKYRTFFGRNRSVTVEIDPKGISEEKAWIITDLANGHSGVHETRYGVLFIKFRSKKQAGAFLLILGMLAALLLFRVGWWPF